MGKAKTENKKRKKHFPLCGNCFSLGRGGAGGRAPRRNVKGLSQLPGGAGDLRGRGICGAAASQGPPRPPRRPCRSALHLCFFLPREILIPRRGPCSPGRRSPLGPPPAGAGSAIRAGTGEGDECGRGWPVHRAVDTPPIPGRLSAAPPNSPSCTFAPRRQKINRRACGHIIYIVFGHWKDGAKVDCSAQNT